MVLNAKSYRIRHIGRVMSNKLMLVDANNLYAVTYYSLKGDTSRLIDSFIGILRTVIEREPDTTHLFVCWDSEDSRKKKEEQSYKAGRTPKPANYYDKFYELQNRLEDEHVQQYVVDDIEADDIIAKIVNAAKKKGYKCVIVSNDKDMYQLIEKDDSVYIFNTVKQTWIDYNKFHQDYGIEPHQFKFCLALMGKASNNISGVKGIGEKTAIKAIQAYGDLDKLYSSDFSGISKKFAQRIKDGKDDAYKSLRQVEFLEDFKLPKPTNAVIPNLFRL